MSYGNLIADAILNPETKEQSLRRLTCKACASSQCTCHCGAILDEKTVHVLERTPEDGSRTVTIIACCPDCRSAANTTVRRLVHDRRASGDTFTWLTWNSTEIVDGISTIPERSAVPGLSIVRQHDVARGPGKYRIVHDASDSYVSTHSSKRKARQCLAELDALADWTLSASALKRAATKATRERISLVCKSHR